MARKKLTSEPSRNLLLIFAVFVAVLFTFYTPAFASSFLRLNHEFLQARNRAIDLIDTMSAVRETLMTANSILPIRVRLMNGNNFSGDKFYKDMLSKKSSDEVFKMFFDFLTEDEDNGISGALKNIAAQNGTKFRIYWLWLYPTNEGLSCVRQEDMTNKTAEEIWNSRTLFPILGVRYPLPEFFQQKGVNKVLEKFPSAYMADIEIVHMIFPDATGIPEIIRKTVEFGK